MISLQLQNNLGWRSTFDPIRRVLQYAWPNGDVKYVCTNRSIAASEADQSWDIVKYSEDGLKQWGILSSKAVSSESNIDVFFLGYA